MLEKKLVKRIDVQVYPVWQGGFIEFEHPLTGKNYMWGHQASKSKMRKLDNRVDEIVIDDYSVLVVVSHCGTKRWYVKDNNESYRYNKRMKEMFGKRCIIIEDSTIDSHKFYKKERFRRSALKRILNARGYDVDINTQVYSYGHHWGACAPELGKEATKSLELPMDNFHELHELSVLSHTGIIERTIHRYNASLYNEIVEHPEFVIHKGIFNYLYENISPLKVKHMVEKVDNVAELLDMLGKPFFQSNKEASKYKNLVSQ